MKRRQFVLITMGTGAVILGDVAIAYAGNLSQKLLNASEIIGDNTVVITAGTSNIETKNISKEFLDTLDTSIDLFRLDGTDYALVTNSPYIKNPKSEPIFTVSYDFELEGQEAVGLRNGQPLLLKENLDGNFAFLEDTDLDGRVNKCIGMDGKALHIKNLQPKTLAELQKRYENGLISLIGTIHRKFDEYTDKTCEYEGLEAACNQLLVHLSPEYTPPDKKVKKIISSLVHLNNGKVIYLIPDIGLTVVIIKPEEKLHKLKQILEQLKYVSHVGYNGVVEFQ